MRVRLDKGSRVRLASRQWSRQKVRGHLRLGGLFKFKFTVGGSRRVGIGETRANEGGMQRAAVRRRQRINPREMRGETERDGEKKRAF